MSQLTRTLSDDTLARLRRLADATGLTADEVVTHAVRRWADDRLTVTREQSEAIMAKVPDVPPVPGDEIDG